MDYKAVKKSTVQKIVYVMQTVWRTCLDLRDMNNTSVMTELSIICESYIILAIPAWVNGDRINYAQWDIKLPCRYRSRRSWSHLLTRFLTSAGEERSCRSSCSTCLIVSSGSTTPAGGLETITLPAQPDELKLCNSKTFFSRDCTCCFSDCRTCLFIRVSAFISTRCCRKTLSVYKDINHQTLTDYS